MNRKAFLLGFFSIGGQVLLLRELVSSFNGDELFIGTALFGWLISVAGGAFLGGKANLKLGANSLFIAGAIFLPIMITAARFSPLLVTEVPGEIIPFSIAALLSVLLMIPVGVVSGWLFPAITREGYRPTASIVQVYLFEGIGAFIGGIAIVGLVGLVYSSLAMVLALCVVVIGFCYLPSGGKGAASLMTAVLLALILIWYAVPFLDGCFDGAKYKSYNVESSFDTHYGHQTILSRDDAITLLSDNTVEAVYPDLMTSENLLIPPLVYKPESKNILYIGRTEFGIMQMAEQLSDLRITALDPRYSLSQAIDEVIPFVETITRIDDDQISYFARSKTGSKYDIIILSPGEPDNYKNSRLLTDRFLAFARSLLKPDGLLYFPSRYDTDRYIAPEKKELLSIIYNTFRHSFNYVNFWPGEMTLFFASDTPLFGIKVDSLIGLMAHLNYAPQYLSEYYLLDRLTDLKIERLRNALNYSDKINSINKPILTYHQAIFRSRAGGFDRGLISLLFKKGSWAISIPVLIILLFILSIIRNRKRRVFGLFLYFTAGIVSLTLELISFYIYQSSSGSLYSEMAVLIGAFMLGLAFGTYYSQRIGRQHLEYPALLLLLASAVIFLATFNSINPQALLFYHIFFLFTMALATGSLFVAATDRFYLGRADANRGLGYAFELIGSSMGAALATTVFLPLIGLQWLLISVIALIIMTLIGAILTS